MTKKSVIGQMRIYVNGGNASALSGTTFSNSPTEFIHFFSKEHDIALKMREYIMNYADEKAASAALKPVSPQAAFTSAADELWKLKGLLDEGVLIQEEFNRQKQKILNS